MNYETFMLDVKEGCCFISHSLIFIDHTMKFCEIFMAEGIVTTSIYLFRCDGNIEFKGKKLFFTSHDLGLSFCKIFMNFVVFFAADAPQRSCLVYVLNVSQRCNHGCVLDVV